MKWHDVPGPKPLSVVQVLAVTWKDEVLLMHRNNEVRSAKNIWSFPCGMHEVGETVFEAAQRELLEETGLKSDYRGMTHVGVYENIAGDEGGGLQYHWLMNLVAVFVDDPGALVNLEPDKHDQLIFVDSGRLGDPAFYVEFQFHDSFRRWMLNERGRVVSALYERARMGRYLSQRLRPL